MVVDVIKVDPRELEAGDIVFDIDPNNKFVEAYAFEIVRIDRETENMYMREVGDKISPYSRHKGDVIFGYSKSSWWVIRLLIL